MYICPHCRSSREGSTERYCNRCGGDTHVKAVADTMPPVDECDDDEPGQQLDFSSLRRYWETDVLHWRTAGATPEQLRALLDEVLKLPVEVVLDVPVSGTLAHAAAGPGGEVSRAP